MEKIASNPSRNQNAQKQNKFLKNDGRSEIFLFFGLTVNQLIGKVPLNRQGKQIV